MRLRNLFESVDDVAIIFGRFNPPHKGHKAAWEMMSKYSNWYVGTNASTQGPKDPLPFDVKIEAMKTIYPELKGHLVSEQSWLSMASEIYKKHPTSTLLVFTDEDWVTKTILQYNGIEGKAHGFYNFKNIEQKTTPRLSSATALRDAVSNGDRDAFTKAAGVDSNTPVAGKPFFDLVAEYLLPYANTPKKTSKKKTENLDEAPIEMDPSDPMDPMIYGTGANPGKLKYRMMRAAGQIKDLAGRVDKASPGEWQNMVKQFDELKMNIEQIKHGLEELAKVRKKGGVRSRGIDPMIDSVEEGWKSKMAGAALAAANLLGSPAQAAEEPVKPITIAYVMIDGEVKKYNLGDKFSNAREAEKFISSILDKHGLSGYTLDIKHGYPKKKDVKESSHGRYWCSTDKKWKTRKGPKQKRSS